MIKRFLSISLVFSSLFAGMCTVNVAHGYTSIEKQLSNHSHETECEHCEEINEQEVNCCGKHLENVKQAAIVKPDKTKALKNFTAKALQPKAEISIPEYEKEYAYRLNENKAPPHLQFSLPRLE